MTSQAGVLEVPGVSLWGKPGSRAQTNDVLQRHWPNDPTVLPAGTWASSNRHRPGPEGLGLTLKSPVSVVPSDKGCRET